MKYVILIISIFLFSCTKTENKCSDPKNASDPECRGIVDQIIADEALFTINFKDTYYYDINSESWAQISSSELSGGTVTTDIPAYSTYTSISKLQALDNVLNSTYPIIVESVTETKAIPFIEIEAKSGVTYLYRYQKYATNGSMLAERIGQVPITGGRAILPLVNEVFSGDYFSPTSNVGTRYKNTISITAQANQKSGAVKTFTFYSVYVTPSFDFKVTYSSIFESSFNIFNRWNYYYSPSEGIANDNLHFITLENKRNMTENAPVSVRVLFKDPTTGVGGVRIKITEIPFFEIPFEYEIFKQTGTVVTNRGSKFMEGLITLDSYNDFQLKTFLDNVSLSNGNVSESTSYVIDGFPAGKKFDLSFSINLNNSSRYGFSSGDPNVNGLLYPLRPICYAHKLIPFLPISWQEEKQSSVSDGNFKAICHTQTTRDMDLEPNPLWTPTNGQNKYLDIPVGVTEFLDTWYDAFSYAPLNSGEKRIGHFYGLKSVSFSISGCVKIQIKAINSAGQEEWVNKTTGGSSCGGGDSVPQDWTYFSASKTYTIFTNEGYSTPGLTQILDRLQSVRSDPATNYMFNGETLNGLTIRHLY